jgi:phage-related baseplate assembly protein
MADPVPFIAQVINTAQSTGGMDAESDESLAERVFLAPSGYSVAGSEAAYVYHAKSYSTDIGDVKVTSPSPGIVDVRFLMADGSLPTADDITGLSDYLSADERRPLTDYVQVSAPETVSYTITATYYISRKNQAIEAGIKTAVEDAVEAYKAWQGGAIGRDINPDELIRRMMQAGAKRVTVTAPAAATVGSTSVGACAATNLTYGGFEDD